MVPKEFFNIVKQTKLLWEKIWSENKAYGADSAPYLVIYNPNYRSQEENGESNIPVSEIEHLIEKKQNDIETGVVKNKRLIKKYGWLGLFSGKISPFNIEVRFRTLDMDLIRRLRKNPLISHIENQKDWSDAVIRVILYKYQGGR